MSKGWSSEDIPDQSGRIAVVTGGNSGIGLITCRELARHGAQVILASRNAEKGASAVREIRSALGPEGSEVEIEVRSLDLASLESVKEFAESVSADFPGGIDLLINNAGVMAPPQLRTKEGFELQIGTNHLGHFALTGRMFDALKRKPRSRVVTISSVMANQGRLNFEDLQSEAGYGRWRAYGQSKLANLVFALDLQLLIAEAGLDMKSLAAHPGVSDTNLTSAGNDLDSSLFGLLSKPFLKLSDLAFAQSPEMGALPTLRAATDPALAGGSYIGPDGFRGFRGSPVVVAPRKLALNREIADKLWTASVEATGVDFNFDPVTTAA